MVVVGVTTDNGIGCRVTNNSNYVPGLIPQVIEVGGQSGGEWLVRPPLIVCSGMLADVGIDVCPDVGDVGRTHVPRSLPPSLRAIAQQRQDNCQANNTFRSHGTLFIYITYHMIWSRDILFLLLTIKFA